MATTKHKVHLHVPSDIKKADGDSFLLRAAYKERLAVEQKGRCAVCKCKLVGKSAVDHCHTSKLIRGLLCSNCNSGLGFLKDSPVSMLRAAVFILKTRDAPVEEQKVVRRALTRLRRNKINHVGGYTVSRITRTTKYRVGSDKKLYASKTEAQLEAKKRKDKARLAARAQAEKERLRQIDIKIEATLRTKTISCNVTPENEQQVEEAWLVIDNHLGGRIKDEVAFLQARRYLASTNYQ